MQFLMYLAVLLLAIFGLGLMLRLLNPLPSLDNRTASSVLSDTGDTRLGTALRPLVDANQGLSGILPLPDPREAFAARTVLMRSADRSLDLQYYIWHGDISGTLLMEEARNAADRGVRVRLLLDDNGTAGIDEELAALDAHPNVEIRLFNPFTIRWPKFLGYLTDFFRLNRRMHNKSLTADNHATIVGGRNIGDEYLGTSRDSLFADLDVLAIGEIVPSVSQDFDLYWNCASAYPLSHIVRPLAEARRRTAVARSKAVTNAILSKEYDLAVAETQLGRSLMAGDVAFTWALTEMASDDPSKGLGECDRSQTLLHRLKRVIGSARSEVGLVSAYFVPTNAGTAAFVAMAEGGVKLTILTNALNATDVAAVHAGYARHRRALLRAGVTLWELKGEKRSVDMRLVARGSRGRSRSTARRGSGSASRRGTIFRSSGSSLHAKTFAIDRDRLFVGSFNFDPRSANLNTELGFLIHSPDLASGLQDMFGGLPEAAYRVQLAADGKRLEWVETEEGRETVHKTEPGTTGLQRGVVATMALLPIDWML